MALNLILLAILIATLCLVTTLFRTYSRLRHVPGPWLAKFSNLWKLRAVFREDMPRYNIAAHQTFGDTVRIGPNHVSISNYADVDKVYGFHEIYAKSVFYTIAEATYDGRSLPTLFTTPSNEYHARLKRASAHAYTMTAMRDLEPLVDKCVSLFIHRLSEVSKEGQIVDMGTWFHYFAFDVLGEINFSNNLGFMRTGSDVGDTITLIDTLLKYISVVGQIPTAHLFLFGNPILHKLAPSMETMNNVQNFALKMINDRKGSPDVQRDLLTRLLEVHEKQPEKLSYREVLALTTTNIAAGSDTTATVLRTALYHLCCNPTIADKLRRELQEAEKAGTVSSPISYNEAIKLPYLSAVLNESLRIHPPTGFILERVVPPGGLDLANGLHLPEGTICGANPWVLHRDSDVYGHDVDVFRPERWIEASPEQANEMNNRLSSFGIGPRLCIGKNISVMELWKCLPELMQSYDFQLVNPANWKTRGLWFVTQKGLECRVTRRAQITTTP